MGSLTPVALAAPLMFSPYRVRLTRRLTRAALGVFTTVLISTPHSAVLAGDILRGGGTAKAGRSATGDPGNPTAAATLPGLNARDTLGRTSQALQAVRAMQDAARAAASSSTASLGPNPFQPTKSLPIVPNGLVAGGLKLAPGVPADLSLPAAGENPLLWSGAKLPTQTNSSGQTNVNIVQTNQQALLNWQTFNVGKETNVTFDQTAGGAEASQWIAFNKINDPSGVPSQILGSLNALGQVYLINANGIIFGGSSQVNLHSLVASALPINDNLISRGLLNNPDNQFLFSALPLPSGTNGTPAFTPVPANTFGGNYGDVSVQAGATLTSPTSADHVGGRIALFGANVRNDGTINTPDGQTILGAGLQVGLGAHTDSNPALRAALRGLDVYVGDTGTYGGSATNNGLINAPRADVTLAGSKVNQLGFINSTTSVAANGRIDLLASFDAVGDANTTLTNPPPFLFQSTGQVTLGPNSVTQVVPEYASTQRVVGTQLALPSQVNIQGLTIHEGENALLFAPSARVDLAAGSWVLYNPGQNEQSQFVSSTGQIYLDANAVIDVSGSKNISAPVSENVVAAQLLGPELANSPLQRNGPLRGKTVYVDITKPVLYNGQPSVGTPLADVRGYAGLVQRTVGELTTDGGTVSLSAGDSVVLQKNSLIDVSGGWVNFAGGMVHTTQVTSGGNIFDISQATPDRVYDGILDGFTASHPKYGVVETTSNPFAGAMRFEAGFTQGMAGGSLRITAPSTALDGQFLASTVTGVRQSTTPPAASSLALVLQAQDPTPTNFLPSSPFPPRVTFADGTQSVVSPFALDSAGLPLPLPDDRKKNVFLSPGLVNADGFGNLTVDDSDGNVTVPQSVALKTGPGGTVSLSAANLFVLGSITAPGGSITLNAFDISPAVAAAVKLTPDLPIPAVDPSRGGFLLGSTARLDTSGSVTDLRSGALEAPGASYLQAGGKIAIGSFSMDLQRGSSIAADGGLTVSGTGQIAYGAGGSISLAAGQDLNLPAVFAGAFSGKLNLGATLSGLSGAGGGALSILAPFIRVGGQSSQTSTLLLSPDFFSEGGFANFTLAGVGDLTARTDIFLPAVVIAAGTQINPVAQSQLARLDARGQGSVTATSVTLPEGVRNPVSLNFQASGIAGPSGSILPIVRGDFVMEEGASIKTDGRGSVAISANTAEILGSIQAPGGAITVAGGGNSGNFFHDSLGALFTVDLGAKALLSTAGEALLTPNSLGLRSGSVLNGGSITLSGDVAARAGSVLDVSGATAVLDMAPGFSAEQSNGSSTGAAFIPTRVDSNGGFIVLKGSQELFVDSTLRGAPGGPSATGGTLTASSGLYFAPGSGGAAKPTDPTLQVTQTGDSIPAALAGGPFSLIGSAFAGEQAAPGHFAADRFNDSGLASLNLKGSVLFNGPVTINAPRSLAVADGGVIFSNVSVSLNSPYVSLGTAFRGPITLQDPSTNAFTFADQPFSFLPVTGAASLSVSAGLIDIGNLSLQGIGNANLVAKDGDIRGDGTLDIAGNLRITAGQIYPPTATAFTIAAYDYPVDGTMRAGTITLTGSGTRPLPLSAGGTVNIYGSLINDGGIVRAPIGTINLGSDGTGAPFIDPITLQNGPTTFQVQLLAGSVSSVSTVDPATGKALLIPYGVSPDGKSWIDPAGNNITVSGLPAKTVNVAGQIVSDQAGSTIDIRGGGDLYAYQFQSGVGGTVDILNAQTSFAVLPGNDPGYAPFISSTGEANAGYSNSKLAVGDQIHLRGSAGLPEGNYTLLPARYALLPGAFLVTQVGNAPTLSAVQPTGAAIVSGYAFNGFDPVSAQPLLSSFEVASPSVVRDRALYIDYSANAFLKQTALDNNRVIQRLPIDSGRVLFDSTREMSIDGSLAAQAPADGRGGEVDISTPIDIRILGPGGVADAGALNLEAASLSAFGAESLLIGGKRTTTATGTVVTATTGNITVDDAGSALTGPDVILVANGSIALAPSSVISQTGTLSGASDALIIGNKDTPGSGNGVLIRVSGDPSAAVSRLGVTGGSDVSESVGANAILAGASVTLDSTAASFLDLSASLRAQSLSLNSGQIDIVLDDASSPPPSRGLVLSGATLGSVSSTNSLSLLSYSLIDIYGSGTISAADTLSLHAAAIQHAGGGGDATFRARVVNLDNSADVSAPVAGLTNVGALEFDADTIRLGANLLQISQFASVTLTAANAVVAAKSGSLSVQGDLTINAPVVTGTTGVVYSIPTSGNLQLGALPPGAGAAPEASLGAELSFSGSSITSTANFELPSGRLSLHASEGDLQVNGGTIDVGGTAQKYFDLTKYTSGGSINLTADKGSITLANQSSLNVSAANGGGDGGSLSISAPQGNFASSGALSGVSGLGGESAIFSLDVGSLASLTALNTELNAAGYAALRSFRIRTGDVSIGGVSKSGQFDLSADHGSIDVIGTIDGSGVTGGAISLTASGSISLETGSVLTVAANQFDAAGKGGTVYLSAGAETNGVIDQTASLNLMSGSKVDVSVAANSPFSAQVGDFTGTVHLRAPQTPDGADLQIQPVGAAIIGASAVVVEGYALYDLTGDGTITSDVQSSISANGIAFGSNAAQISARLFNGNDPLKAISYIEPGAEITNRSGNITLGSTGSTPDNDWDLHGYRFGAQQTPGVLTLRAAGDLAFYNTLSDGFSSSSYDATLLPANDQLLPSQQSWSYHLTAGADFGAADYHAVVPVNTSGTAVGSVLLGKNYGTNVFAPSGASASTSRAVANRFQVIRTGSGDIDISASQDVKLLNQFATIYTAGTQVADATLGGTFDLPNTDATGQVPGLGTIQQTTPYPAQYSMAGGNVSIYAQHDITHQTLIGGILTADSTHELPLNWLYRRGFVDPLTGQFGNLAHGDDETEVGSTTWWVDFSNFFEGVATLGGGNVSLSAGRNVSNVDAAAPTNARLPARDANGALAPNAGALVELGGGDVTVRAGGNIDGGVYYVERGTGKLDAGRNIVTNQTRSPSLGLAVSPPAALDNHTWLPTTLFLGKGSFDVEARGDALLGPVANVFLLPEGINNSFWYKTVFSTYDPSDTVNVSSLTGAVTLREGATLPGNNGTTPLLEIWLSQVLRLDTTQQSASAQQTLSFLQPWLRLNVTNVLPFTTLPMVSPGSLFATSFSGDVNLVGNLTLSPSATGTIDLVAHRAINGLQPSGSGEGNVQRWSETQINLSDADPARIPGTASPFAFRATLANPLQAGANQGTDMGFLNPISAIFLETGSTSGEAGVLQAKQILHATGLLHVNDPEPVHLYATSGDLSGVTLFSGKTARISSGQDISDIALFVQNVRPDDTTVIQAGRDLTAFDLNSKLLAEAGPGAPISTASGDIQISGPGTLEVLAGRNLDLGISATSNGDTGLGITSIGNGRNPALPFAGANIVAGAGIGISSGLSGSEVDFTSFIGKFLDPAAGELSSRYLPSLGALLGLRNNDANQVWSTFKALPSEKQDQLALQVYYLVLRDAGRDHNNPDSPGFGNYANGEAAVATLFPGANWHGDISLTSREINTRNGGDVSLFAPGGRLDVGVNSADGEAADQGILTESGGNISVFTAQSVNVGTSRVFTLRGGNEIIWSTLGDIAAGSAAKTVLAAPPTRVLVDPQSADVKTDLAGLATGGGIGVLESVAGVPPSDIDLIAPTGTIDAGDAGIRVSGNLNLAAVQIINASNISVGGTSAGVPTVAAPNLGALTTASNSTGAVNNAVSGIANQNRESAAVEETPSIITVDVVGYGGGESENDQEEERKKKRADAPQL